MPNLPPLDHGMFQLELLSSAVDGSVDPLRSPTAGQQPTPGAAELKAEGGTSRRQGGTPAAAPPVLMGNGSTAYPLERTRWRAEADAALGLTAAADRW